jgi:putative aminopeptidase FrvX
MTFLGGARLRVALLKKCGMNGTPRSVIFSIHPFSLPMPTPTTTLGPEARTFLFDLLKTPSPTGFEMPGQRVWASRLRGVADSVQCDAYGNTWATLTGTSASGPVIMLEAHADEIGYMIKFITPEGFLRLERIGGVDNATGRGRRLDILGDKGVVRGIVGNTAIHIREKKDGEKAPEIHDLYVDVGAANPAEVAALGLRVGHAAVYADGVEEVGSHYLCGRALDNRIGGFIIAEVLAWLAAQPQRPQATLHVVNAVQEEIGGNGARMITHRLQPSVAVCLDVTHATDTPGIEKSKHGLVKLGGGPAITHGSANHPLVVDRLMAVAESATIPLQHESSSRFTGTDTDKIFTIGAGVPSALISLPLRYMHSVVEMADLRDVDKVIELLAHFVLSINAGEIFHQKL